MTHAFTREDHTDHAEIHRVRVIQSECGKSYTLEEFLDIFDHDHNLALTEESFWTPEFKDEFYTGWPVFATHMRLRDPACGSTHWSLPVEAEQRLKAKKAKEEADALKFKKSEL